MRSMENLKGYGSTLRDNTVSNKIPTIIDDIAFEDIVRHLEDEFAEEQRLLTSEKNFSRIEGHNIGITNLFAPVRCWRVSVKIMVASSLFGVLLITILRSTHLMTLMTYNIIIKDESNDPKPLTYSSYDPPVNDGFIAYVTNEYSVPQTLITFPYPFLEDGSLLMEPYRASTVTIEGITTGCDMYWNLAHTKYPEIVLHGDEEDSNFSFIVTPIKTGLYILTVEESCSHYASSIRKLKQMVWVKYVRREILSLNEKDRDEFLDAFRVLWDVPTQIGIEKYGLKYKSLNYLAMIYNDLSGNKVCDEFHSGAGFVNNMVYFSAYLEQSLRLVNPRISLHYMDYGRYFNSNVFRNHIRNPFDGGSWTEIMTDKWFGRNNPISGEILDSRWAYTEIPYLTSDFINKEMISNISYHTNSQHVKNAYGLLRSPWNYNPNPFLTRFNNINQLEISYENIESVIGPTCDDYFNFITDKVVNKPLQNFLESVETSLYGNILTSIGGSGGSGVYTKNVNDILRNKYKLSNGMLFSIALAAQNFLKKYYSIDVGSVLQAETL